MYRTIHTLALALSLAIPAFAQTKVDLGTQVKGQLPPANAIPIFQTQSAQPNWSSIGRGLNAQSGEDESWSSDLHPIAGTSTIPGWDGFLNYSPNTPGQLRAGTSSATPSGSGTPYYVGAWRGLAYARPFVTPATHWGIASTLFYHAASSYFYLGIDTCTYTASYQCNNGASGYGITANGLGFQMYWAGANLSTGNTQGGSSTQPNSSQPVGLWPTQSTSAQLGNSDIGLYGGFGGVADGEYTVSAVYPGDGTLITSILPAGQHLAGWNVSRWPVPALASGSTWNNFFVQGGDDRIMGPAVTDGIANAAGGPVYSIPDISDPTLLRWTIHKNGTESTYASDCPNTAQCQTVTAILPPHYGKDPNVAHPWVLLIRGDQYTYISVLGTWNGNGGSPQTIGSTTYPVANVVDTLLQAGYVIIVPDMYTIAGITPSTGWGYYHIDGDADDSLAIAQAITKARQSLHLAPNGDAMADSSGGWALMAAITHGVIKPEAVFCVSCSFSTVEEYDDPANPSSSATLVGDGFGFSPSTAGLCVNATTGPNLCSANPTWVPYTSTGMATYDALDMVMHPSANYGTTAPPAVAGTQAFPMVANPAVTLATTPMLVACDPQDEHCNTTDSLYVAAVNALNPGDATLESISGAGHIGQAFFNGAQVLSFFTAHH